MTDAPVLRILASLQRLRIPHMLTGSYASNVYGRIRSTFDADLVVAVGRGEMASLVADLDSEFYLESRTLAEAREAGNEFNAIHKATGMKVDFFLVGSSEYDRAAFRRRRRQRLLGRSVPVISAEDLILAKLRWARAGGSQRQVEDAAGIVELREKRLDRAYLRRWAVRLSILDLLERLGV